MDPTLLIAGTDLRSTPPVSDGGSLAVYGGAKLLRAAALIPSSGRTVEFPQEIPELVASAYDPGAVPPPEWAEAWAEAEVEESRRINEQEQQAETYLIPRPQDQRSLVGFSENAASDPESARAKGKKQVRDADDSIEVIVLQRSFDGQLRLPAGIDAQNRVVPEHPLCPIPDGLARLMARTTLALPVGMTKYHFDAVEASLNQSLSYENWEHSLWLRGQLALVLDSNLETNVATFHVRYHPRKGLMYERLERPDHDRIQSRQ